jgi:hypothetical protein
VGLWVGSPEQAWKKLFCPRKFCHPEVKVQKCFFSEIGHDWYKKNPEFYAGFKPIMTYFKKCFLPFLQDDQGLKGIVSRDFGSLFASSLAS